jgi:tetratricopeptide (TPR) repeat protein
MGETKLAREIANHSLSIAETLNDTGILSFFIGETLFDSGLLFDLHLLLAEIEVREANFDKAIPFYKKASSIAKEVKSIKGETIIAHRLAKTYTNAGNLEQASKQVDISIESFSKKNFPLHYLWALAHKAYIYWVSGEIEKAEKLREVFLPSIEKTPGWDGVSHIYVWRFKGFKEWTQGNIDTAIEYMTEAINIAKKQDDKYNVALMTSELTPILFDKGDYERVLDESFAFIDTIDQYRNPYIRALFFETMGRVYHIKGDYNLALEYVQKSLISWKKFKTPRQIAQSLFSLIQITTDKNDKKLYSKYLKELESFVIDHSTTYLEQFYQIAQALVLRKSSRPRDWFKAIDLLVDSRKKKFIKQGHAEIALINLCELLLNEFSISGDEDVLKELEYYVGELSELANSQNIYHLRLEACNIEIRTHMMKAQKSMVEIDFQKTKNILENARKIADEEGLYTLAEKLTLQQELLLSQLSQWDDFIQRYYEYIEE